MIWLAVILLAGLGFGLAIRLLGLPRSAYALLGTALALGLAGYALQGSPGLPGQPRTAQAIAPQGEEALIAARRAMFGDTVPPARYVAVADGFTRRGQTEDAAGFLRVAVAENPADAEAWVALGNTLVLHAQGNPTPAATEAYARAAQLAPESPAPSYFQGLALLRSGRALEARDAWAAALDRVPADAPYRPIVVAQLEQLHRMIDAVDAQRASGRPLGQAAP